MPRKREPPAAIRRVQHFAGFRALVEFGMADDPGAGAHGSEQAAGRHGGDAVGKLDLAHGLHLVGAVGAVHGAAFDEDRGADVVAGVRVRQQFVEQVAAGAVDDEGKAVIRRWQRGGEGAVIPQMVVRVDDRQVGLDDCFA